MKSSAVVANYIGLITGVIILFSLVLALNQAQAFLFVTVWTVAVFATVGVLHFGLGRLLSYSSVKNIGANQAAPIISTQVLYALILAVIIFGENITLGIAVGSALVLFGVLILEGGLGASKRGGSRKKGYLAALATGGIFGFTPILIKAGLQTFHFYVSAILIAYATALAIYAVLVNPKKIASDIRSLPRYAIVSFVISGILSATSQIFRFGALNYAPIVVIVPILGAQPIFTVIFTHFLAKDVEVFNWRTILSIVLVILGTIIVSYSSGTAP